LQNNPQFSVEQTDSPLPHEKKKYELQFLPDRAFGAGFYVCKLRKK
jgi:16S rRNA C967 or C1407 C5-methylase (RsmB/RsmF family)